MNKTTWKNAGQKAYDLMDEIPRDDKSNPLTLEGVIRSVILKNPSRAQYRDTALDIIYCVLGSGIDWDNGRLVDTSPNNYMNMPPGPNGQGCWARDFGRADSLKQMLGDNPSAEWSKAMTEIYDKQKAKDEIEQCGIIETVSKIDERCQQYSPKKYIWWYPISWYSCHLCVPAKAQEDFLDGAIETATLITNANPTPGTKLWMEHQRTKQYAIDILEILLTQKKLRNE